MEQDVRAEDAFGALQRLSQDWCAVVVCLWRASEAEERVHSGRQVERQQWRRVAWQRAARRWAEGIQQKRTAACLQAVERLRRDILSAREVTVDWSAEGLLRALQAGEEQAGNGEAVSRLVQDEDVPTDFFGVEEYGLCLDLQWAYRAFLNDVRRVSAAAEAPLAFSEFLRALEQFPNTAALFSSAHTDAITDEAASPAAYRHFLERVLEYLHDFARRALPDRDWRAWLGQQRERHRQHLTGDATDAGADAAAARSQLEFLIGALVGAEPPGPLHAALQRAQWQLERKLASTWSEWAAAGTVAGTAANIEQLDGSAEKSTEEEEEEEEAAGSDEASAAETAAATPVPGWMRRAYGLHQAFRCEICGPRAEYHGALAYERHFNRQQHVDGLHRLGIRFSPDFDLLNRIDDARRLERHLRTAASPDRWV